MEHIEIFERVMRASAERKLIAKAMLMLSPAERAMVRENKKLATVERNRVTAMEQAAAREIKLQTRAKHAKELQDSIEAWRETKCLRRIASAERDAAKYNAKLDLLRNKQQ